MVSLCNWLNIGKFVFRQLQYDKGKRNVRFISQKFSVPFEE